MRTVIGWSTHVKSVERSTKCLGRLTEQDFGLNKSTSLAGEGELDERGTDSNGPLPTFAVSLKKETGAWGTAKASSDGQKYRGVITEAGASGRVGHLSLGRSQIGIW